MQGSIVCRQGVVHRALTEPLNDADHRGSSVVFSAVMLAHCGGGVCRH